MLMPGAHQDQEGEISELELHKTKNRIAAVDIARVIAALLVMYGHIQYLHLAGSVGDTFPYSLMRGFVQTCSCIFFVFAGYFACRNITWKKAIVNSWWCFAPFALWNTIGILALEDISGDISLQQIRQWFGLTLDSLLYGVPVNGPLWFMRDLTWLFLISPIVYRLSKYLFPLLFFLSLMPVFSPYFTHGAGRLYSLAFFVFGCWLRSFPKDRQQAVIRFYSPVLLIAYTIAVALAVAAQRYGVLPKTGYVAWPFVRNLIAIVMVYELARCVEVNLPKVARFCVYVAPVTFLTFGSHWIIYQSHCIDFVRGSVWALLLPPAIFALMSFLFFAMKRWCHPLLHLVAHYKLRPDDLAPKQTNGEPQVGGRN